MVLRNKDNNSDLRAFGSMLAHIFAHHPDSDPHLKKAQLSVSEINAIFLLNGSLLVVSQYHSIIRSTSEVSLNEEIQVLELWKLCDCRLDDYFAEILCLSVQPDPKSVRSHGCVAWSEFEIDGKMLNV